MSSNFEELDGPFADPATTTRADHQPSQSWNLPEVESSALGDYNPFESREEKLTGTISSGPGFPPTYSSAEAKILTTAELERRQRELDAKAAELARREEEQNRLAAQAQLRGFGSGPPKNWPPLPQFFPCKPCFYQNIELEINLEYQKVVRVGYYLWIAYASLLALNLLGTAVYFGGTSRFDGGTSFGVALLVFILFVPASYICWFRPLYKAFRSNSSINFFIFFLIAGAQILGLIIQSLGISSSGSCGWLTGLSVIKSDPGVAALLLLIACLFTGLTTACTFYLIHVHKIYRSTGATFGKAREEFARGVVSDPTIRSAALETGLFAARQATSSN
ncbi:Secretory carrier-associated membrane protein [Fasciolopsis buskii]|uniref:Secretory carrier-associated membrane protein n=1 Tax=Fasciolopsis buskii TaxID=27845 RepID=A0A8E0VHK8_9TREM|nr:Secretory carrier-associated membrane protein [Fasciolopsis buski]